MYWKRESKVKQISIISLFRELKRYGIIYVWTLALTDIHFKLVNITLYLSKHGSYILNSTIPILFFLFWNARRIIIYVFYQHIYINTYTHERGEREKERSGRRRRKERGEVEGAKKEEGERETGRDRMSCHREIYSNTHVKFPIVYQQCIIAPT